MIAKFTVDGVEYDLEKLVNRDIALFYLGYSEAELAKVLTKPRVIAVARFYRLPHSGSEREIIKRILDYLAQ